MVSQEVGAGAFEVVTSFGGVVAGGAAATLDGGDGLVEAVAEAEAVVVLKVDVGDLGLGVIKGGVLVDGGVVGAGAVGGGVDEEEFGE